MKQMTIFAAALLIAGWTFTGDLSAQPRAGSDHDVDPSIEDPTVPAVGELSKIAPIIAQVELNDGTTVDFVAADAESIAIVVGGPIQAEGVDVAMQTLGFSRSPAELYRALTDSQAPGKLVEHSDAVLRAGNWKTGKGVEFQEATVAPPSPQSVATCSKLRADGEGNLHGSWGNCALYNRNDGQTTTWTHNDVIAAGAHVIGVSGSVFWDLQKRNCTACNWHVLYTKTINAGYHYFYWYANNNNDSKSHSRVTSQSNGGQHYHKSVRCHDWNTRAQWTSGLAGGCSIQYWADAGIETLYCEQTNYFGADPSNIFTSSAWDGNGTPMYCP